MGERCERYDYRAARKTISEEWLEGLIRGMLMDMISLAATACKTEPFYSGPGFVLPVGGRISRLFPFLD